jgi:cytochrome b6-f complex iron-sulfur subunit
MNARGLRRYVDDLLCGRRPKPFDADRFEAALLRTAIELRAARTASDAPREHFLTDLHRRLAARVPGARETPDPLNGPHATRRQVVVAASAAALAGGGGMSPEPRAPAATGGTALTSPVCTSLGW